MSLFDHIGLALFYVLVGGVLALGFVLMVEVLFPDTCRPLYSFLSSL